MHMTEQHDPLYKAEMKWGKKTI